MTKSRRSWHLDTYETHRSKSLPLGIARAGFRPARAALVLRARNGFKTFKRQLVCTKYGPRGQRAPGRATKWRVGHVLTTGVTYCAVPQPVLVQLGAPPAGYCCVRAASDILLLSLGTRMVMDAMTNLGGGLSRNE
jgi:hypothetical protein